MALPDTFEPLRIDNTTDVDFTSPDVCNLLEKRISTLIAENAFQVARNDVGFLRSYLKEVYPQLATDNPQQYARLRELRARLEWKVLDMQNRITVQELMRNYLAGAFDIEFEILEDHLKRVVTDLLPDEREEAVAEFRNALLASSVQIGSGQLQLGGSQSDPTVANWLRDFVLFLNERSVSSLEVVEYMNQSEAVRTLDGDQKHNLETALKLYAVLGTKELITADSFFAVDPQSGHIQYVEGDFVEDTGVEADPEQLELTRYVMGYNSDGTKMDLVDFVRTSPQVGRYLQPNEATEAPQKQDSVVEEPEQSSTPGIQTQQPPLENKYSMESIHQETEDAIAALQTDAVPSAPIPTPVPPMPASENIQETYGHIKPQAIAQQTLAEHQLLMNSYEEERRFIRIVASYVQGGRTREETLQMLAEPAQEGGVNMDAATGAVLLDTADYFLAQELQKEAPVGRQQEVSISGMPTFDQLQQQMAAHSIKQEVLSEQPVATPGVEDIFSTIREEEDTPQPKPLVDITDVMKKTADAAPNPTMMGPVQELENMTLKEFRAYDSNPQIAGREILENIELLEQQSLQKKAEGIDAWKRSPVNQQYILVGNKSFSEGISVQQAIASMQEGSEDVLTEAEFNAIADINRQLRF